MDREGKDARFPVSANQQVPGALTRCVQAAMGRSPVLLEYEPRYASTIPR